MTPSVAREMRALFVNENIGGHATMHLGIRHALAEHPEVEAEFLDAPDAGLLARVVRAPIPGLARLDLDLGPLRAQLARATWIRRALQRRRDPYDVLHVYSQNAALMSVDRLRTSAAVVSTDATGTLGASLMPNRAPSVGTARRAAVAQRLERRVFEASTIVVAQSDWTARSLRDDYGIEDDRLRVIPFGIIVPDVVRREPATTSGLPEITWVGTTMQRKGGRRLLELFRTRLRDRAVLNLVTRDDVDDEPGVQIHRDVYPNDGKLDAILARTAVFAFPSEMDTFGYAALEAMARRVPVVGLRLHALPEIIDDGVTGVLVDPADDDALAAAILGLLDDPDARDRMGEAARARVLERFDARATTAQLIDVLHEARERAGR